MKNLFLIIIVTSWISGCGDTNGVESKVAGRWYTQSQIELGTKVYSENCIACHAPQAKGTQEWMKRDVNGKYPPPPLNGTAHTWHHPLSILKRTITQGGIQLGGVMPGFGGKLKEAEKLAAIAYVQSFWSDKIYDAWDERGGISR